MGNDDIDAVRRRCSIPLASRARRQILLEYARARQRRHQKGGARSEGEVDSSSDPRPPLDVLAIDEALEWLRGRSEHLAEVAELRFFAGMSLTEVAEFHGTDRATSARDWRAARALLSIRLGGRG